jgi:hypothetical protein
MHIKFTTEGPLFNQDAKKSVNKIIDKSLVSSAKNTKDVYKSLTPVRTGKLYAGWREQTGDVYQTKQVSVYNDVPYAGFIFTAISLLPQQTSTIRNLFVLYILENYRETLGAE